jgi:heterodisulfide reductase subunit B
MAKVAYYPGCTLKATAPNLEAPALACLKVLGVEVYELPRWNCCGAVASLCDDDILHQVAPVRNLIRAKDAGADSLVTLCAPCYNTLARANLLVREDEETRKTLNLFMEEESDYAGELDVVHFLAFLRDAVGFDRIKAAVKKPLTGLKVAPYYGCTLMRPRNVAIEAAPTLLHRLVEALGAEAVDFPAANDCCGAYQMLGLENAALDACHHILDLAVKYGAEAIVSSCPLCDYNLGTRQPDVRAKHADLPEIPTYYFTQLMAVAFGLDPTVARFDRNPPVCQRLLAERALIAPGP